MSNSGDRTYLGNSQWAVNVLSIGSTLVESKTESDAEDGVITFSAPVSFIEIYTRDDTNDGVFTVNGIPINIPAGAPPYISRVSGEPSEKVFVSGSTAYVINRYE